MYYCTFFSWNHFYWSNLKGRQFPQFSLEGWSPKSSLMTIHDSFEVQQHMFKCCENQALINPSSLKKKSISKRSFITAPPFIRLSDVKMWHRRTDEACQTLWLILKGNSGIFKPRPYFWHEIRSSTHQEQFGESRRPSKDI